MSEYWIGGLVGCLCGYLWGYRSAVIYLGGRLHPERGEVSLLTTKEDRSE